MIWGDFPHYFRKHPNIHLCCILEEGFLIFGFFWNPRSKIPSPSISISWKNQGLRATTKMRCFFHKGKLHSKTQSHDRHGAYAHIGSLPNIPLTITGPSLNLSYFQPSKHGGSLWSPCSASISHFLTMFFCWYWYHETLSVDLGHGCSIFFLRPFDTSPRASCSSISVSLYLSQKPDGTGKCQDLTDKTQMLPEALCHRHYESWITNHPSSIIHQSSSIVNHPSIIIYHESSIVHESPINHQTS